MFIAQLNPVLHPVTSYEQSEPDVPGVISIELKIHVSDKDVTKMTPLSPEA